MDLELKVGPIQAADSTKNLARGTQTGGLVVAQGHGLYAEAGLRGKLFYAANQAAQGGGTTWSVGLNVTHTGLVVSNPVQSKVNLSILMASFAMVAAPVAIAHIGLFAGFAAGGIVAHTTPLIPMSTFIGNIRGSALADEAATLVGTPAWIMPILSGFTAGALYSTSPAILDIKGSIIVPPGGYVGIGALSAVVGLGGVIWEEIPIL